MQVVLRTTGQSTEVVLRLLVGFADVLRLLALLLHVGEVVTGFLDIVAALLVKLADDCADRVQSTDSDVVGEALDEFSGILDRLVERVDRVVEGVKSVPGEDKAGREIVERPFDVLEALEGEHHLATGASEHGNAHVGVDLDASAARDTSLERDVVEVELFALDTHGQRGGTFNPDDLPSDREVCLERIARGVERELERF